MADVSDTDGNQHGAPVEAVPIPLEPRLSLEDGVAAPSANGPAGQVIESGVLAALEARVRRLEAELANIQDTRVMEDRVVQRVSKRIRKTQPTQIDVAKLLDIDPVDLPTAPADGQAKSIDVAAKPTESAPVAQAVVAPVAAVAPVAVAAVAPVAAVVPDDNASSPLPPVGKLAILRLWLSSGTAWLFLDALIELRCMWRMLVDPRFRLTWGAKVMPIVLLGLIATSWYWLPGMMLLSGISTLLASMVDKLVDLLLAFFLFKVLNREVRRYRETAPDLPASLRP